MQRVIADASIRVRRDIRAMAEGRLRREELRPRFRIDIAVWIGADVRQAGFFLDESATLAGFVERGALGCSSIRSRKDSLCRCCISCRMLRAR